MEASLGSGSRDDSWHGAGPGIAARGKEVRAARLFATEGGQGRNVLLLHGWTCDSNDWNWQLPPFESRYRVVALDLRGHGRSEVMPSGGYSPDDYLGDLEALIDRKYTRQRFVVVGHSMGAQIAARLAAKRPDLVDAVVSIDGALGFSEEAGEVFCQTARDLQDRHPAEVVPELFRLVYSPATDPAFIRWHTRRVQGMPAHVVRESFAPLFFGNGAIGLGEPSAAFCRNLVQPVYHLCCDPAQAARMRPWFQHPKSRVEAWSDTGHWIMLDRTNEVNAAVSTWIDAL